MYQNSNTHTAAKAKITSVLGGRHDVIEEKQGLESEGSEVHFKRQGFGLAISKMAISKTPFL